MNPYVADAADVNSPDDTVEPRNFAAELRALKSAVDGAGNTPDAALYPNALGYLKSVKPAFPQVFDYVVDGVNGNDSNDGSAAAPWASLNKIGAATVSGQIRTILVKTATYNKATDYIETASGPAANTVLNIWFEAGCLMDGSAGQAASRNGFEFAGLAWTVYAYGNGTKVRNYGDASTGSSPNGIGNRNTHILYAYNFDVAGCDDAFSTHDNAQQYLFDCVGVNGEKSCFANVGTSYAEYYRCRFTFSRNSAGTINANGSTGAVRMYDCQLIPSGDNPIIVFGTVTELVRTKVGTFTVSCQITAPGSLTLTDCFVNLFLDGNMNALMTRCYGNFSGRTRNNTTGTANIRHRNCVYIGPASASTGATTRVNSVYGSDSDFGSSAPFSAENCIFKGYSAAIGLGMSAGQATQFVAAGNYVRNVAMFGNTLNIAANLASASPDITGTVTADPLIGAATSWIKGDYAIAANSPCAGAGVGGADIGFKYTA